MLSNILNAFALVGLWGYLRQVPVGWKEFWAVYFVLSLALSLVALVANATYSGALEPLTLVMLSLASLLVLPLYFALWQYAFSSPRVWSKPNA